MESPTPDELRRELDHKRDALTRDMERLEAKVKDTFSLSTQISERPLLSVGLATLAGFVIGNLGGGHDKDQPRSSTYAHGMRAAGGTVTPYGSPYGSSQFASQGASSPSIIDQVRAGFRDTVHGGNGGNVEAVLATMTAAITALLVDKAKTLLDQNLPGFAAQYDRAAETDGNSTMHETSTYSGGAMGPSPYPDPLSSAASTAAAAPPIPAARVAPTPPA